MLSENGYLFADYQEADYVSSGWDDWVIDYLNGKQDVASLRKAITATGVDSKISNDFLNYEGRWQEDYATKKERLLRELSQLEKEEALAKNK